MPPSIKDFAALKPLRKTIKAQDEARIAAQAKHQQQEQDKQRDAEVFRRSIGAVAALAPTDKRVPTASKPVPIARQHLDDDRAVLAASMSDEFTLDTLQDGDETSTFARNGIGPDIARKLRRGHWMAQSQLDLHGLRTEEARNALAGFLQLATQRGLRCVRVIHGKGLGSLNQEPVLKHKVRNWLVQKEEVLAFCPAKAADGGTGALVVLLKVRG